MGHQSYVLLCSKMTSFPPSEGLSEITLHLILVLYGLANLVTTIEFYSLTLILTIPMALNIPMQWYILHIIIEFTKLIDREST